MREILKILIPNKNYLFNSVEVEMLLSAMHISIWI